MFFYNQLTIRMAWKNPVEFFPTSHPIEFQDMLEKLGFQSHPSNDAMAEIHTVAFPGLIIRHPSWTLENLHSISYIDDCHMVVTLMQIRCKKCNKKYLPLVVDTRYI